MPVQVNAIMLAVEDLARARAFYVDGLGGTPEQDYPNFVRLSLGGGPALALYPRADAAADAGVPADGSGFRGVSFHHFVGSKEEVDEVVATAVTAGATVVRPAEAAGWGYFGYVADPDGYLWKIAAGG